MYNAICEKVQGAPTWTVSAVRHFSLESKTTNIDVVRAAKTHSRREELHICVNFPQTLEQTMRVSGRETLLARDVRPSRVMAWALERSSSTHWPCVATDQDHLYVLRTPSLSQSVHCRRQQLLIPISV